MDKNEVKSKDYYTIDIMHILRSIWYKAWIVILVAILAATAGFYYSAFCIEPVYSSSILLYVNSSSINVGTSLSINAADITTSERLVKTYTELLKNYTTLDRVAKECGLGYSAGQLNGMIVAGASNETEVMKVTVTCTNPDHAAKIANTIAEVLPVRVSEIVDGTSMTVVDSARANYGKIAPSVTRYTAMYMMIGAVLTAAIIAVVAVLDDTIHDEEYVIQNYKYPILAKVPDLLGAPSKGYGYYYQKPHESDKK